MYHDDVAYCKSRAIALAWIRQLRETVSMLVSTVANEVGIKAEPEYLSLGSFNCCYSVKALHSIYRFPILSKSAFRYEKTNDECMIMTYISRNTSILIPKLIAAKSCDLGPYLIMSFVDGSCLSDHLRASSAENAPLVLNPSIDITFLATAYRNMAKVLIELSGCRFTHIGGVARDDHKGWCVKKRPITMNMNQIVSCGNFPPNLLPEHAFSTANEYFTSLAETHIMHFKTQRNDAVDDEADCQKKYVARHLFLKIARNFSNTHNHGPFPLYCDDLRPSNVLVDSELNFRGVIDWEYCYAAPAEFTYCSPWWLLLRHPEDWEDGDLGAFLEQYLPRQRLFLQVLQEEEGKLIERKEITEDRRLSVRMAESIQNGHFWFCLAATSSYGFDDIYWRFIDPIHYGPFTSIEDRIGLLDQQEQDGLDSFVQLKMRQAEAHRLDDHRTFQEMFAA